MQFDFITFCQILNTNYVMMCMSSFVMSVAGCYGVNFRSDYVIEGIQVRLDCEKD